jgi:hypothetical protein
MVARERFEILGGIDHVAGIGAFGDAKATGYGFCDQFWYVYKQNGSSDDVTVIRAD